MNYGLGITPNLWSTVFVLCSGLLTKTIRRLTGERILLPLSILYVLVMEGTYGYIWQRNMKYCDMS